MPAFGRKKVEPLPDRTSTHSDTLGIKGKGKALGTSESPAEAGAHIPHTGDSPSAATHQVIQTKSPPPSGGAGGPLNSAKLVPRDYFDCPMSDLAILVSSMLQDLVTINDTLPFNPDQLTRFHSRSVPGISIQEYIVRIIRFCTLEKSILITMIYFIDLLCQTYSTFNINSLTVHRFMITAAMVASKGLCDSFCTNSHYARVGGLSKVEMNLLEVEFLTRVDYRIVPQGHLLDSYYERMVMRLQGTYAFPPVTDSSKKKKASVIRGVTSSLSKLFASDKKDYEPEANKPSHGVKRLQETKSASSTPLNEMEDTNNRSNTSTVTEATTGTSNANGNSNLVPPTTPKKLKPSP